MEGPGIDPAEERREGEAIWQRQNSAEAHVICRSSWDFGDYVHPQGGLLEFLLLVSISQDGLWKQQLGNQPEGRQAVQT